MSASLYGCREVLIASPQKILQTQVFPSAISYILHKVSTCMTYYRQQLSQNHIIRFTCPLDRWDSIFCSALDNQLLNNTVSLLATNQSSTVILQISRTNVMQKPGLPSKQCIKYFILVSNCNLILNSSKKTHLISRKMSVHGKLNSKLVILRGQRHANLN